ncbi:uncharacterized protein CTRU02_211892 [Colletotrichum truncatum]|uniref:Uncharacterized protein n=1 Tax=Colletotrichum truncatum TaxID=5467 RepID=A0ACC3YM05_COLTU|nr:uncharacterized protein CTRU02_07301 [Colletotrichum truncatum]KAF6791539.1 hypothetical protein CTRU02_07301 [Colletotrichum truncatum]
MRAHFVSVAWAVFAVFSQQAYACTNPGTQDCPQNCGGFADNICHLPGGYCKCEPY